MKKSSARNVYALQARPFVNGSGHRLYASQPTVARAGQKLVCSELNETNDSLTIQVRVSVKNSYALVHPTIGAIGPCERVETWGGTRGSEFVEKPVRNEKPSKHYALVHPTLGQIF